MERKTISFAIVAPLLPGDLPGLCGRVCELLERSGAGVAFCDVAGIAADATAVDALARLQLAARRRGAQIRLRRASKDLVALIDFMGLADVVVEATPRVAAAGRTEETVARSRGRTSARPPGLP